MKIKNPYTYWKEFLKKKLANWSDISEKGKDSIFKILTFHKSNERKHW